VAQPGGDAWLSDPPSRQATTTDWPWNARAQALTSLADLRNDPGISSGSAENSSSGRTSIKTGPVGIPTKRTSLSGEIVLRTDMMRPC
jgi:hypothetical protein